MLGPASTAMHKAPVYNVRACIQSTMLFVKSSSQITSFWHRVAMWGPVMTTPVLQCFDPHKVCVSSVRTHWPRTSQIFVLHHLRIVHLTSATGTTHDGTANTTCTCKIKLTLMQHNAYAPQKNQEKNPCSQELVT